MQDNNMNMSDALDDTAILVSTPELNRSTSDKTWKTPRRDKENYNAILGSTTPFSPRVSARTTPRRPRPHHKTPSLTETPSSKLLRKHFRQLALTPGDKRRLMSTGAIRIDQQRHQQPQTTVLHSTARIGYDGTFRTPSRELLRSTVSSRNHRRAGATEEQRDQPTAATNLSVNISLDSSTSSSSLCFVSQHPETPKERRQCGDPVALTLLNGGREDYSYLLERDTDAASSNHHHPAQVSARLADVLSETTTLARPIAVPARLPV